MTDLYGVRVLAVDLPQRRIRLRTTAIYYDSGAHAPLTDDASFFLRVFAETADGAPLGDAITVDQRLDETWVDASTRFFVESVERIATRNYPLTEEEVDELLEDEDRLSFPWEEEPRFDELSPEAAAELVLSEEANVGADYDVVVTDHRWIEHLAAGDWWRTASYPTQADRVRAGEAAAIPDLRRPAVLLKPFGGKDEPRHLAFSDDGRFLAVTSEEGELVVYETAEWSERVRTRAGDYVSSWLMWVPGEPLITLRHHEELHPQVAYDAVRGAPAEAPPQSGRLRSATGRYRTEWVSGADVGLLSPAGEVRVLSLDGSGDAGDAGDAGDGGTGPLAPDPYAAFAFSADEARLFAARGSRVYVLDPADGRTLDVIAHEETGIRSVRVSPCGEYLALSVESPGRLEVLIQRVGDHRVVTRHAIGRGWYPLQTYELAWSPDGRWLAANLTVVEVKSDWEAKGGETRLFRVGLPTEPSALVTPPSE
ncbi:WD40 repeat domain-containing protein [Streptomyces sp. NPDC004134]|uniref:WD40 repeat domain-containing protein n=1 Tax=Streptomyces sp. NPDC004134 TaxID=3364691 RepID=UPI0036B4A0E5